jgi:hypothetical protein
MAKGASKDMIVPALHLEAAVRGVDVSTSELMRTFAETVITRLINNENVLLTQISTLEREARQHVAEIRALKALKPQ